MTSSIQSNKNQLKKDTYPIQKISRPTGVTILALLVLLISMLNIFQFIQAIQKWDFLASLLPFSPIYLLGSGFFWGIIGLIIFWGLWRGKSWATVFTIVGISVYVLYYWTDRLVFPAFDGRNFNWLFSVGISILILVYCMWILTRQKSKNFFGGADE
jgi:hypothetical protein